MQLPGTHRNLKLLNFCPKQVNKHIARLTPAAPFSEGSKLKIQTPIQAP